MLSIFTTPEADPGAPRSQARLAYERLRGDIVSGRHAPDKRLKIQDLATDLQVSPGAVREALSRLVSEHLVVSRDQRGFAVAPLSIADLEDLTDLRCDIEAMALRRSVERGDVNWEAGLLAAAHRLRSTAMRQVDDLAIRQEWVAVHATFHAALVAAAGSRRLLTLHAQLYEQSERYRGLSAYIEVDRKVDDEHQVIVDLALARDADGLVKTMIDHLRRTTTLIIQATQRRAH